MLEKENLSPIILELQELNVLTETLQACQSVPESLLLLIQSKALRLADSISQVQTASVIPDEVQVVVAEPLPVGPVVVEESVFEHPATVGDSFVHVEKELSFMNPSAETMNDIIAKRMTVDLTKALTLNDRFRFLRELFHGNAALMDEILSELNGIATVDEAKRFLSSRFEWDWEMNETVSDFMQIVEKKSNQ